MKKKSMLLTVMMVVGISTNAFAGDCVMKVSRTACPGKDKESFSKCGGEKSCDEKKKTGSAEACAKEAVKACGNKRYDITQDKTLTASFDGKPVEGGKDFCKDKSDAYDPGTDYPFRGKADCK